MALNNIYQQTSPYFTSDVIDNKFLDIMINRQLPFLASDVYFEITPVYQYRPDTLAFDLYNDSRLWWVFAQRNPDILKDPLFDFVSGVKIYIPKLTTLKDALGI